MNALSVPERVVLLHGLAETPAHMMALEVALRTAGYSVSNIGYPSTSAPSAEIADTHIRPLFERFADAPRLHFVTHSMGGVLLHYCLTSGPHPANLGRVVMQAPGHHGSPVLELYRHTPLYKLLFGPPGQESGLGPDCFACHLPHHADYELGVLAGAVSVDPLSALVLPWPQDGRLSVDRTRLDGMRDLALIPAGHDLISFHPLSLYQTWHFLKHGAFWHARGLRVPALTTGAVPALAA